MVAAQLFDERGIIGASQDGGRVVGKAGGGFVDELADERSAQVAQLLLPVAPFEAAAAGAFGAGIGGSGAQFAQERQAALVVDEAELEAIFKVDDAVANIVGRLDQKGKRVAVVEARRCVFGQQAQLFGYQFEARVFGLKMAVFLLTGSILTLISLNERWTRVLGERPERGIGEPQPGRAAAERRVGVRENAKARRVALKVLQVGLLGGAEAGDEALGRPASEVGRNRIFARVAERRVADVVGEAGGRHDIAAVLGKVRQLAGNVGVVFEHAAGREAAQRAAHAGRFERVREAGMHEIGFRQRHHLGFALQAPEGRREHYPVIIS